MKKFISIFFISLITLSSVFLTASAYSTEEHNFDVDTVWPQSLTHISMTDDTMYSILKEHDADPNYVIFRITNEYDTGFEYDYQVWSFPDGVDFFLRYSYSIGCPCIITNCRYDLIRLITVWFDEGDGYLSDFIVSSQIKYKQINDPDITPEDYTAYKIVGNSNTVVTIACSTEILYSGANQSGNILFLNPVPLGKRLAMAAGQLVPDLIVKDLQAIVPVMIIAASSLVSLILFRKFRAQFLTG
ncbi:MAG: hypothetical protein ACI4II_02345 [Acutalibacteraceae bacterium]